MSASARPSSGASPKRARSKGDRSKGDIIRTAVWVLLAVLITLFAVLNTKSVRVDWIFGSSSAPLIIVIVISLLVGVALTHIAERRSRKHRQK